MPLAALHLTGVHAWAYVLVLGPFLVLALLIALRARREERDHRVEDGPAPRPSGRQPGRDDTGR